MKNLYDEPISSEELEELDTDKLKDWIKKLLDRCDDEYFAPIMKDKDSSNNTGEVSHNAISNLNRMMPELTSRYLLSGF